MKKNLISEVKKIIKVNPSNFDPLGSYTGESIIDETPTQDSDDL